MKGNKNAAQGNDLDQREEKKGMKNRNGISMMFGKLQVTDTLQKREKGNEGRRGNKSMQCVVGGISQPRGLETLPSAQQTPRSNVQHAPANDGSPASRTRNYLLLYPRPALKEGRATYNSKVSS